jgi:hypothetical protein
MVRAPSLHYVLFCTVIPFSFDYDCAMGRYVLIQSREKK